MPRPWTLSDLDSDSESDIPTQTRQRFSPPKQKKKKREKDRKTFVAFQWKTFSGNRWSANYACSCSAAFFFVCFVFTFREALKAFGLLMFVQNLGGSIWVLLHSVSACRFYSDLSWPKWFGLSLIYQPSKAELLACGLLKHVSTSAGWVAFHVAAVAFPLWFGPESLQAILPPSLHHVAATSTSAFLLKKLSRGEDDDSGYKLWNI